MYLLMLPDEHASIAMAVSSVYWFSLNWAQAQFG
jgi:hypothetical protein